jgi:hypothetical protein
MDDEVLEVIESMFGALPPDATLGRNRLDAADVIARCRRMVDMEPRIRRFSISPDTEAALHSHAQVSIIFHGDSVPTKICRRPYNVAALPAGVIWASL